MSKKNDIVLLYLYPLLSALRLRDCTYAFYTATYFTNFLLSRLMNALQPGIVSKIVESGPNFKMMENVNRLDEMQIVQLICIFEGHQSFGACEVWFIWDRLKC